MLKSVVVFLCLVGAATAQTKPAAKPVVSAPVAGNGMPSEDAVDAFMKQMVGYNPEVTWKVAEIRPSGIPGLTEVTVVISSSEGSNTNKFYVTSDGKHAVTGDIIPFGSKPFEQDRVKLEKGVTGPAKGPAKAPVTIVEFSDMQCPHCKQVAPVVETLLTQEPDAHFVFQNFPLPMHDWAEKAAGYVDCVGRKSNDAVWKFIQKTFEQQESITAANADEKLKAIATESGVDAEQTAVCAVKPDTKARIETSLALGKAVGVTGTPAIFINGRLITGGAPVETLKQIVDFQKAQN
ncbi:MAG TPA: thioredoxin domain-containing protein [Terriglobales bacterium]|jgi:protein-disulfide isomerase|nr:thioredoxin domain-containing protein [Terriglobales bacterium]